MADRRSASQAIRVLQAIQGALLKQRYDIANENYLAWTTSTAAWPATASPLPATGAATRRTPAPQQQPSSSGGGAPFEDDQKRKILTAVKRLMSFFQNAVAPQFPRRK